MRREEIYQNICNVLQSIKNVTDRDIRLVTVSKTWPVEDIQAAYDAGQRHFGENYTQELLQKYAQLPGDIFWHYIGALQDNKLKSLASIPNLYLIETLDNVTRAKKLNSLISADRKLKVFIQVNTSGEVNKHGVDPSDLHQLVQFIRDECENLIFSGLMTIGSILSSSSQTEINPDFQKLSKCREYLAEKIGIPIETIDLSMGMSNDYLQAIKQGSTEVRVGSIIFGSRKRN